MTAITSLRRVDWKFTKADIFTVANRANDLTAVNGGYRLAALEPVGVEWFRDRSEVHEFDGAHIRPLVFGITA